MPRWKGIIGRGFRPQEFKDYVSTLTFTGWRPEFVVVHNTSKPRLAQWHSTPGETRMRNSEAYYKKKGWSAGPHLFVADDLIWVFTPLTTSGIHSPSWNAVSWGVEMVGEYEEEPFNAGVRENTIDALAILHMWRGIDPLTLRLHKEDPKTQHKKCPGRNLDKADLVAGIQSRMISGHEGEHQPQDDYIEIGAFLRHEAQMVAERTGVEAVQAGQQLTQSAASKTKDGKGRSRTSGLFGTRHGDSLDATEKLEAVREGKRLGEARIVRQVRVASPDKIIVHQSDYSWSKRIVPHATLFFDCDGFTADQIDQKGEASYFGKYDSEDEGTGCPAFGTIQTNSSVFGVALPRETLLKFNLAKGVGHKFHATAQGSVAMVEIYNPKKRRLVRAPIVDIGPGKSTRRPIDLTVAAAAFLQNQPEEKAKGYKLPNIQVQIRIV